MRLEIHCELMLERIRATIIYEDVSPDYSPLDVEITYKVIWRSNVIIYSLWEH